MVDFQRRGRWKTSDAHLVQKLRRCCRRSSHSGWHLCIVREVKQPWTRHCCDLHLAHRLDTHRQQVPTSDLRQQRPIAPSFSGRPQPCQPRRSLQSLPNPAAALPAVACHSRLCRRVKRHIRDAGLRLVLLPVLTTSHRDLSQGGCHLLHRCCAALLSSSIKSA